MNEPVLVTQPEFEKCEPLFVAAGCESASLEEQALADAVAMRGARVVILGPATYRGPLYEALGRQGGGLIARFGVGHDGVNKALARQHNIIITNTPRALDASVAEHATWLMGCLARRVSKLEARMRNGEFVVETGVELSGKTLGILGFGGIGRRVAQIAEHGLGMKVLACDVGPGFVSAEELFRQSDVLSVHLPSNAETRHFINATRLSWMKPIALLVNTARGAVLDEAALYDALVARHLAGAALDVFEIEPYQPVAPGKDLRTLDNVVLTPHIGSNTREANRRMAEMCLENVRRFLTGELKQLTIVKTT
jgi:lactate dehydrogenase-like 2-hydroxyacid dehydrogenase